MIANAPEKMYLIQDNGLVCYCRNTDEDVEYTRTDAFIEKACAFIRERLIFDDTSWYTDGEVTLKDEVIEDFKNYMKEE